MDTSIADNILYGVGQKDTHNSDDDDHPLYFLHYKKLCSLNSNDMKTDRIRTSG